MDQFLKLMVPDDESSSSSPPLTPVHTLAFIDLETTGLPCDVGKKNVHITELSVVAIDRQHFEDDYQLRVLHKLNIFIRPRATISFGASAVTGLYDDMLEFQKPFDESVLKILEVFFSRLRSPICLIAHNGNKFDFPLLQAELKRLALSLPPDITCADTLEGFRIFGYAPSTNPSTAAHGRTTVSTTPANNVHNTSRDSSPLNMSELSPVEINKMLNEDIEIFQHIDEDSLTPPENDKNYQDHLTNKNGKNVAPIVDLTDSEKSPKRNSFVCNDKTESLKSHFRIRKSKESTFHKATGAKRKLFDSANGISLKPPEADIHSNKQNTPRRGFSLEKLYMHYFGEKPDNAHKADADCVNLCKICQKVSHDFLPWLDNNQIPFSQISSMW